MEDERWKNVGKTQCNFLLLNQYGQIISKKKGCFLECVKYLCFILLTMAKSSIL